MGPARCYIANKKPKSAWELYLRMETSNDSFSLLQLIANDCYLKGQFFYSAKAFDVLERLDPNPEYWEGKRGACVGVFQAIIAGKESRDLLRDVVSMLRNTSNPQVEYIIRIMKKWARETGSCFMRIMSLQVHNSALGLATSNASVAVLVERVHQIIMVLQCVWRHAVAYVCSCVSWVCGIGAVDFFTCNALCNVVTWSD